MNTVSHSLNCTNMYPCNYIHGMECGTATMRHEYSIVINDYVVKRLRSDNHWMAKWWCSKGALCSNEVEEGGEKEEGRVGARNRRVHACVCVCVCACICVCDSQLCVTLSVNITLTLVYQEAINTGIQIQCCNSRLPCNMHAQNYTHTNIN